MFWPFAALCLLTASRWMLEGAYPATASTYTSQAVGCGLAALIVVGLLLPRTTPRAARPFWSVVVGEAILLSGPELAVLLAGRSIHSNDATLALALCPVVVAVAAGTGSDLGDLSLTSLLWPALASVAGLLLLLPEPSFPVFRPWLGLAALPLLVGGGAAMVQHAPLNNEGNRGSWSHLAQLVGLVLAAIIEALVAWTRTSQGTSAPFSFAAAGLDGAGVLLTLMALRRMGSLRWSAQFLVIPLLGFLEGMLFLHPVLDWRSYLALGLLAVSAGYQLLAMLGPVEDADQGGPEVPAT